MMMLLKDEGDCTHAQFMERTWMKIKNSRWKILGSKREFDHLLKKYYIREVEIYSQSEE